MELAWALGKAMELEPREQAAALADLMHDDVVLDDHRPFALPPMDRTTVAAFDDEMVFAGSVIVSEYIAINGPGARK